MRNIFVIWIVSGVLLLGRAAPPDLPPTLICGIVETNSQVALTIVYPQHDIETVAIFRKAPLATKWGQPVETITKPPFPSIWVDSTTKPGEVQEYKIAAALPHSSKTAYGFVTGGIRVPPIHHRGRALLIIDQGVEASLSQELVRFQHDLAGDGWTVVPHSVPSEAPGPCVTEIFKYEPGNLAGTYRYVVTLLSDRSESEPSPPLRPYQPLEAARLAILYSDGSSGHNREANLPCTRHQQFHFQARWDHK